MYKVAWLSLCFCCGACALQEDRARLTIVSRDGASSSVDASLWSAHCAECVLFGTDEAQTTHVGLDESCIRLLDMLMVRFRHGEKYAVLIDELYRHPLISSLFELIYKNWILSRTDPLFHVIAQAYVRKKVRDVQGGSFMLSSPAQLCAYIDRRFADISACLNLYVYASLSRAEREKQSIALLQYIDVEAAMAQIPADVTVVQFVQQDELTSNLVNLKHMNPSQIISLADRNGHLPFVHYGRRLMSNMREYLFSDYWAEGLFWACILQDVARVKEILKTGVSVLICLEDSRDPLFIRVLRWCPQEAPAMPIMAHKEVYYITYPSDLVLDEICRLMLKRALDEDIEAVRLAFNDYPEYISRAQKIMPELEALLFE